MNIKELKGTMTLEDFAEGITVQGNKKTLGAVWEHTIDCNHCNYRLQCRAISDQLLAEHDVNVFCHQVIDYLLGEKTIEDIIKEAD